MGVPNVGFTHRAAAVKLEKERLKREECRRVKHDKLFSDWKVLVGSSDWRSHAADEEGASRYQLHNLPAAYFGPGVYELGLTLQNLSASRESRPRKLRKHDVLVVYLGQAENVRQRLQKYGQSGSHLEGARLVPGSAIEHCELHQMAPGPTAKANATGLRLFTDVFSRGYSIVFRWARTESKQMAEKVESELLNVFDYPWNRGLNGARRPDDILEKLEFMEYHLGKNVCLGVSSGKWAFFQRKVGIKVLVKRPSDEERVRMGSRFSIFLSGAKAGSKADGSGAVFGTPVCGVLLEDGSSCSIPPVTGRKRCNQHKGLRVSTTPRKSSTVNSKTDSFGGGIDDPPVLIVKSKPNGKRLEFSEPTVVVVKSREDCEAVEFSGDGFEPVCGVILEDGLECFELPVKGRKRCAAHKGQRTGNKFASPQGMQTLSSSSISPYAERNLNHFV